MPGRAFAGGASADGVDDHHHGRALLIAGLSQLAAEHGVDIGGGPEFANAEVGQFLAHGSNEEFGVCHNSPLSHETDTSSESLG